MESRNEVFKRLKPRCVALSQTALALNGPRGNVHSVANDLVDLKDVLSKIIETPNTLDEKLADYIFFPLSQILKVSQKVSVRCLELSFQCLSIIIDQGWRSKIAPQLAGQVIILCTLMAEKRPKGLSVEETTDELQESALQCLFLLLSASKVDSEIGKAFNSESNIPQVGQTITVLLDGMEDGGSPSLQLVATRALRALLDNLASREIHASFLPGIVSRLTKVLTPQTKQRRSPAVLIGSFDILSMVLLRVMADGNNNGPNGKTASDQKHKSKPSIITEEWLATTSTQLKPALSTIARLKSHNREDVRGSLAQVCLIVLKDCGGSLANCGQLALDTLIALISSSSDDPIRSQVINLARDHNSFTTGLQNFTFRRLQSLPTGMQSSDTLLKTQRLDELHTAYDILVESGSDTMMLDKTLAKMLTESVVITILPSKSRAIVTEPDLVLPAGRFDLSLAEKRDVNTQFSTLLVQHQAQQEVLTKILQLIKLKSCSASSSHMFCDDLARSLYQTQGDIQLATYWLLLNATEHAMQNESLVDQFINVTTPTSSLNHEHLETLYSFGLSVLTDRSEEFTDARFQSLALRSLALQAQASKREFRYELIDALYPVLHSLATPDEILERDSMVTLNIFASSCGYKDVRDLIVENVDYLTNAVALKLNAFDVSPQAPRVLLMMVRLAGPTLLPYLEDTIESIFAALEDYHGYSLLVEMLFKVLSVVAEEGTKAAQFSLANPEELRLLHSNRPQASSMSMSLLADILRERSEEDARIEQQMSTTPSSHPKKPWKSNRNSQNANAGADDAGELDEGDGDDDATNQQLESQDIQPPAPKIYAILLKITELTQHFLPSASPSLRTSLLSLIHTTIPSIALHENSFLPMINTLWPEIVSRLDDPEPQIVAGALGVIASFCEHAGDFMRTRIMQLWPRVIEILHRVNHADLPRGNNYGNGTQLASIGNAAAPPRNDSNGNSYNNNRSTFRPQSSSASSATSALVSLDSSLRPHAAMTQVSTGYEGTSTLMVRKAAVDAIVAIVRYVDTSPEIFDEALLALEPWLDQPEVSSALESANADAVWLVRLRSGGVVPVPSLPNLDEGGGERRWNFAKLPFLEQR